MDNQLFSSLAPSTASAPFQDTEVPSIRLISAIPSATGLSSYEGNDLHSNLLETSSASVPPSAIAPRSDAPARKRLVPKKSKLGLLGQSRKERNNDFSDVVRRIGADTSSTNGGFEIYVDPMNDPELGDILVVKKQKSRGALNGVNWGPLGEVTNVPSSPRAGPMPTDMLKVKDEEKKWWSIGRGRKDSKEKEKVGKENYKRSKSPESSIRSKTPEPFKLDKKASVRARFNSLDTNILFGQSTSMGVTVKKELTTSDPEPPIERNAQRSSTPESLKEACRAHFSKPTSNVTPAPHDGYSAPPNYTIVNQFKEHDSIALRAIRSVKSLARMGSWAPGANEHGVNDRTIKQKRVKEKKEKVKEKEKKEKEKTEKTEKKKKKKEKKERKEGKEKQEETVQSKGSDEKVGRQGRSEDERTPRLSTSSFEVGGLSANPDPIIKSASQILGKKKRSILSLGIPASIRLPSTRSGSTASSTIQPSNLLVEGSVGVRAKERIGSTMTISSASSLRPISVVSGASASTRESRGSVKWDEEGIKCVKREIQREKKEKRKKEKGEGRERSDGGSRISITEIFPEVASNQDHEEKEADQDIHRRFSTAFPIVTIEEATADGHCNNSEDIDDSLVYGGIVRLDEKESEYVQTTPVKKHRARPMSEQMLGRARPRPVYEDDEGALSVLDAATNDLAQLINNLDLEATPTTPDMPPLRPLPLPLDSTKSHKNIDNNQARFPDDTLLNDKTPSTIRRKKSGALANAASITSLRPYAQSRGNATRTLTTPSFDSFSNNDATIKKKPREVNIGQPITPWPVLLKQISPENDCLPTKESGKQNEIPTSSKAGTWKKGHKRTITPAPEPEPAPVFHPLRPPKSRSVTTFGVTDGKAVHKSSASLSSVNTSHTSATKKLVPPPSLGQKASAFLRKQCSLRLNTSSSELGSRSTPQSDPVSTTTSPSASEKQKRSWMPGTLGGKDGPCYAALKIDASETDSDIPDELQVILQANGDRYDENETYDFRRFIRDDSDDHDVERPRSLLPPLDFLDLPSELLNAPIFNASLTDESAATSDKDIDFDADIDTKKSFDFTGELQKLNELASNRHSFAEQLERAFMTPATVDLRCDFGGGLLSVEVPPVPHLPVDMDINGTANKSSLKSAEEESFVFKPSTRQQHTSVYDNDSEPEAFDPQVVSKSQGPSLRPEPVQVLKSKNSTTLDANNFHRFVDAPGNDMSSTSHEADFTDRIGYIIVSPDHSQVSNSPPFPNPSSKLRPCDGELNTAFKFGGLHRQESPEQSRRAKEPLTLSDIIPPPSQVCLSSRPASAVLEDDSLFQSLFSKVPDVPQPRPRAVSDASQKFFQTRNSIYRHSRASSVSSFSGFDSFDEIRRGFEFNSQRPGFYPPAAFNPRVNNYNRDSILSIASVSSYGRVINPGVPDPFDFGLTSVQERHFPEDFTTTSFSIDDTFSFLNHASRRRRVDSDASSFYFRAAPGDRRRESGMSFTSQAPPVSLYNRGFGGNVNTRSAWRRSAHRFNNSVDSIMSDFSAMRLGRPGVGDKMFETADQTMPLAPISASPSGNNPGTCPQAQTSHQSTDDSIIDDDGRASGDISDSIFDKTDQHISTPEISVFGHDEVPRVQSDLLPPHQFRPLSFMSMASVHSPAKDDDTMITMLDGGYVRRRSMCSTLQASPCVRVEKRKHAVLRDYQGDFSEHESPKKAKVVKEPSVCVQRSGDQHRSPVLGDLLEKKSMEESCFVGSGEDTSVSFRPVPVFTRPAPASRSRSSTCTSSFGGDTPPLSPSDGSSISGGSLSSFDLSEVNAMLPNTVHLGRPQSHSHARARPRGHGHRRRYSHVRSSRTESVYETIEEEVPTSLVPPLIAEKVSNTTQTQPVFIVESDAASISSNAEELTTLWNDERGVMALRRYYALHDEAQSTVMESKRLWEDTPFSIFAVQSFNPPHHPEGMKALLDYSVRNYGPLPSELRPRRVRSRKDSRPSPYPQTRPLRSPSPFEQAEPPRDTVTPFIPLVHQTVFSKDIITTDAASVNPTKPLSSIILNIERENSSDIASTEGKIRRRVGSDARRAVLGRTKRSVGLKGSTILAPAGGKRNTGANTTSMDQKENVTSMGSIVTPMDTLRLNRPRPKGRPMPASATQKTQRPIRV